MKTSRIVFAVLVALFMNTTTAVWAADFLSQLHPYITVKEEYNDNLNLTHDNKKDDFITTVQPGLKFSNMGPTSGVTLDANIGYVMYARETDYNYWNANGNLDVKYMTPEHINFYFKESFTRSDDPREREIFSTEADNKYLLSTLAERAVYWRNVAAPTLEYQFGPENRVGHQLPEQHLQDGERDRAGQHGELRQPLRLLLVQPAKRDLPRVRLHEGQLRRLAGPRRPPGERPLHQPLQPEILRLRGVRLHDEEI